MCGADPIGGGRRTRKTRRYHQTYPGFRAEGEGSGILLRRYIQCTLDRRRLRSGPRGSSRRVRATEALVFACYRGGDLRGQTRGRTSGRRDAPPTRSDKARVKHLEKEESRPPGQQAFEPRGRETSRSLRTTRRTYSSTHTVSGRVRSYGQA